MDVCRTVDPALEPVESEPGHLIACHLPADRRPAARMEMAGDVDG